MPISRRMDGEAMVHIHHGILLKLTLIFGKGMLTGKKSACHCKSYRRCGFDPWAGKISVEEEMTTCSSILA